MFFFFFKPQTRLTSTLKIRDTYRKKSERKSWYNLQEFNCSGQLTVAAYTLNKTLMEHFQAWSCPKILRCGSASTFFCTNLCTNSRVSGILGHRSACAQTQTEWSIYEWTESAESCPPPPPRNRCDRETNASIQIYLTYMRKTEKVISQ